MLEAMLSEGQRDPPQDDNKVKFLAAQLLYAVPEYDPVQFLSVQVLYAVQEEVI